MSSKGVETILSMGRSIFGGWPGFAIHIIKDAFVRAVVQVPAKKQRKVNKQTIAQEFITVEEQFRLLEEKVLTLEKKRNIAPTLSKLSSASNN